MRLERQEYQIQPVEDPTEGANAVPSQGDADLRTGSVGLSSSVLGQCRVEILCIWGNINCALAPKF